MIKYLLFDFETESHALIGLSFSPQINHDL